MRKIAILLTIILILMLLGCSGNTKDSGSITLSIENGIQGRLLQPDLDLSVVSHRITGSGPAGTSFDITTGQSQPKIDNLRFGSWTITVQASNASGQLIASGMATANVDVGQNTNISITIKLLKGSGALTLQVDWPNSEVQNPAIIGVLKSYSNSDISLSFTQAEAPADKQRRVVDTGSTLNTGYYTLIIQIKDLGASGTADHLAIGVVEVVRILNEQVTSGIYDLHGVPGLGSVAVNITQDFDDPISVVLINAASLPVTMDFASSETFIATVEITSTDEDYTNATYVWYLNGQSVGVGASYTVDMDNSPLSQNINGKYAPGHYNLDVTAFSADGSRAGSTRYEFDVTGNPEAVTPLTGYIAVAAGHHHNAAIKQDGTVIAWGNNEYGQCDVPAGLSGVIAIECGSLHTIALKADGAIVTWGRNIEGQCDVPAGLSGVKAIAGGLFHTLVLKNDGTVAAWGNNEYGACDVPVGLTDVKSIAGGYFFSEALKEDGTVTAWGLNADGQCDVPAGLANVKDISVSTGRYTLALKEDGSLAGWGYNESGIEIPVGLTAVKDIISGFFHCIALNEDGTITAWGRNDYGQSDVPAGLASIKALAAGAAHTIVLKTDNTIAAWGYNGYGQCDIPVL